MKIFFDTEFIEDGKTIDLISIGMVKENGESLYMISSEFDESKASDWVKENVLSRIGRDEKRFTRKEIAEAVKQFAGESPVFWADYCSYDWVSLCQLFGTMMDLPPSWPFFCREIRQEIPFRLRDSLPVQKTREHHALNDANHVFDIAKSTGLVAYSDY